MNFNLTQGNVPLYHEKTKYGFLMEENEKESELLQIPELNSGFLPLAWLATKKVLHINCDHHGCYLDSNELLPLQFHFDVPSEGNYLVTVTLTGGKSPCEHVYLFSGRRRLAVPVFSLSSGEEKTFSIPVNVTPIIPRGKTEVFEDTSIDITVLGAGVHLTSLSCVFAEETSDKKIPTLYIAGDSTVTDQTGSYPFEPQACYCGWGQSISAYLNDKIAVSNHAHSGLTTDSFRSEGHYGILEPRIHPGDYVFFQFGHNDQKLKELAAYGGYTENLRKYVAEVRQKEGIPVIVTPLARNTWTGQGEYNDLLKEWANACIVLGKELNVPVLDLHEQSIKLIQQLGLEKSKKYFFPGDFTHTNDIGAYYMAGIIADEIREKIPELSSFLTPKENIPVWIPAEKVFIPQAPAGQAIQAASLKTYDIAGKETLPIPRVEALNFILQTAGFFIVNVYNDYFDDVVGHEWYAGVVEAVVANHLVDEKYTDRNFYPQKSVTVREMLDFSQNAYASRKTDTTFLDQATLLIQKKGWNMEHILTYAEAVEVLHLLVL